MHFIRQSWQLVRSKLPKKSCSLNHVLFFRSFPSKKFLEFPREILAILPSEMTRSVFSGSLSNATLSKVTSFFWRPDSPNDDYEKQWGLERRKRVHVLMNLPNTTTEPVYRPFATITMISWQWQQGSFVQQEKTIRTIPTHAKLLDFY